jgi:adenylyltransferase/sulfurtransferase
VKQLIDSGADFTLVDVREPHEYQICKIDKAKLIPLGDLPKRLDELDKNADIVMHCKMGGRSAKACDLLRASGFTKVRNMTGGILAWADKVDPTLPKY